MRIGRYDHVTLTFVDSVNGKTVLSTFTSDVLGGLQTQVTIPRDATAGAQRITAIGKRSRQMAKATFTVT
jgi:hypothetical protein